MYRIETIPRGIGAEQLSSEKRPDGGGHRSTPRCCGLSGDRHSSSASPSPMFFETHSHADFVSGGPQLAAATGADLYISALVHRTCRILLCRTEIGSARDVLMTALHTPGILRSIPAYYGVDQGRSSRPAPAVFRRPDVRRRPGTAELLGQALAEDLAPRLYDSVFGVLGCCARNGLVSGTRRGQSVRQIALLPADHRP